MDVRRKIRRLSGVVLPLVLVAVACMSCGTVTDDKQQVAEACSVLRTADSLRAQGVLIDDSIALARAVTALGSHQRRHADDYVRACYYYGCLLRKRNNYTAAMQTFINAVHTETQRHDILGRVYSNMGSLCQKSSEFELAYQMYEMCAEQFMAAKDTTMYYFAFHAMAYELAEQKKKTETCSLLGQIEQECTSTEVLTKIWETKARMYMHSEQYDSVIHCVNILHKNSYTYAVTYVLKAQAFWELGQNDSALYYARHVMQMPDASDVDKYNMLYITSNYDPSIDKQEVLKQTSERADINNYNIKPEKKQLAVAVMLLRQDMDRKPYFVNHIYLLLFLFFIIVVWLVAAIIIRKKHAKSAKDIEKQRLQLKEDQQVIISQYIRIKEKTEILNSEYNKHKNSIIQELERNINTLMKSENWQKETEWDDYDRFCETANRHFFMIADKLKAKKVLSEKEIRLCILVMTGCFDNRQIARLICYAESGIRNYKQRIAKKLGISSKDLRTYLFSLAVGESISGNWDENIHTPKNQIAGL